MMCVRRCAQHWRKWAHARSLQRPKRSADQREHWNTPSSHRIVSGINTEWIDLVKYVRRCPFTHTSLVYLLYKPGMYRLLSQHVPGFLKSYWLYVHVCMYICMLILSGY